MPSGLQYCCIVYTQRLVVVFTHRSFTADGSDGIICWPSSVKSVAEAVNSRRLLLCDFVSRRKRRLLYVQGGPEKLHNFNLSYSILRCNNAELIKSQPNFYFFELSEWRWNLFRYTLNGCIDMLCWSLCSFYGPPYKILFCYCTNKH